MARQILPRLELLTTKDKSTSDKAQVFVSATIQFYRQGATVSAPATVPASPTNQTVSVYESGELAANDTVRVGTGSATLTVIAVNSATELVLRNTSATPVALGAGVRLVPTNNRPSVFSDPLGQSGLGTSISTDSSSGRGSVYLPRNRVDYDIVVSGQPTRFRMDASGEFGRSDQRWLDVRDFGGNIQAAIDALPDDGGVIMLPTGVTTLTASILVQKPNVTILGEQQGTVITPAIDNVNSFDLITVERPNFHLADLTLDGKAVVGGSYSSPKCCLVARGPSVSGSSVAGMRLSNVVIESAPKCGLWLRDAEEFFATNSYFVFNADSGVRVEGGTGNSRQVRFETCPSSQNGGRGYFATDVVGLLLSACQCEGNRAGTAALEANGVEVRNCRQVSLRACYFEDAHSPRGLTSSFCSTPARALFSRVAGSRGAPSTRRSPIVREGRCGATRRREARWRTAACRRWSTAPPCSTAIHPTAWRWALATSMPLQVSRAWTSRPAASSA